MNLAETAEVAVRISLDDRMSPALGRMNSNLTRWQRGIGRMGKGAGEIGSGLFRAGKRIAIGLGAAITAAVVEAAQFQDAMAGVAKTVGAIDVKKFHIAEEFRAMSRTLPISAVELAHIGEEAGALGIKGQDIVTFTRTVALLSKTTKLTSDQASEDLGKVGTILGLSGSQYAHFGDVLIHLGKEGASTEDEILQIAKRFGAAGKQAKLSTEDILALASAAASLGAEPEAAGGALSRIFFQLSSNIGRGTKAGKSFAGAIGETMDQAKTRLNAGQTLPMLLEFMAKVHGMKPVQASTLLYNAGIRNVRDRNLIINFARNEKLIKRFRKLAANSKNQLEDTAKTRFDTVTAKATKFWNTMVDNARVFGFEVLPAVSRKLDTLLAFFNRPDVVNQFKEWGKEAGAFLDSIDLGHLLETGRQFVDTLRPAVTIVETIAKLFMALPDQMKGALAGFAGLNVLSGGLIGKGVGDVISGAITSALRGGISMIPGLGRLGATPVYVVNMPAGGFGGGGVPGGAAGEAGAMGTAAFLATAAAGGALFALGDRVTKGVEDAIISALPKAMQETVATGASGSRTQAFGGIEGAMNFLTDPNGQVGKMTDAVNQLSTFINSPHPDFLGDLGKLAFLQYHPDQTPNPNHERLGPPAPIIVNLGAVSNKPLGPRQQRAQNNFRKGEREYTGKIPFWMSQQEHRNLKMGHGHLVGRNIDNMRIALAQVIRAQGAAQRAGDTRHAAKLAAKADRIRERLATANRRLAQLTHKKTTITIPVSVPITTSVNVSDVAKKTVTRSRLATKTGFGII